MLDGFYRVDYGGRIGMGAAAMAFVSGKIAGLDVGGNPMVGTYRVHPQSGEVAGTIELTAEEPGVLVTGAQIAPGQKTELSFRIPAGSLDGRDIHVQLPSGPVVARLRRICSF
jgi:hypothetical protein